MDPLSVHLNKDFIYKPVEKYKEMLDTIRDIHKTKHTVPLDNIIPGASSLPSGSSLPTGLSTTTKTTSNGLDTTSMQNELQSFLNELKKSSNSNTMRTYNQSSGTPL